MRYLYLLPAVALVVGLFLYSVGFTLAMSFTRWNGLSAPQFVGLSNYFRIFQDPAFMTSLTNTVIWVVAMLVLPVGIALAAAVFLQNLRGQGVFKNIFYLPYALSATTTGVIWSFLLSGTGLPTLFAALGWHALSQVNWLDTPPLNTYAMIIASTWQAMGTNMLLFLVGLQQLDRGVVEAAALDGASGMRMFRHITFPLLQPITTVIVAITLVVSFQTFNIIWVMTEGGPYGSSQTLAVLMYRDSFDFFRMGYGAAIAVLLAIVVLVLSGGYIRRNFQTGPSQ